MVSWGWGLLKVQKHEMERIKDHHSLEICIFLMIMFLFNAFLLQDGDGLLERYKNKRMEILLELHNKTPVWNDGMSEFIVCFRRNVSL